MNDIQAILLLTNTISVLLSFSFGMFIMYIIRGKK